jgi:hypothetical protein
MTEADAPEALPAEPAPRARTAAGPRAEPAAGPRAEAVAGSRAEAVAGPSAVPVAGSRAEAVAGPSAVPVADADPGVDPAGHPLLVALRPVAEALAAEIMAAGALEPGDIPLEWEGERVGGLRLPGMHGALGRLIEAVERELGAPLGELDREDKQRAVRLLDDRGAFTLRRAVEDVADALGVSRITVYNYLNSRHRPGT